MEATLTYTLLLALLFIIKKLKPNFGNFKTYP